MHFLVKQSLGKVKAALASGGAERSPLSFVAVRPYDLEVVQRAARGEGLEGVKWPPDGREVCVQRRAVLELVEQVERRAAQAKEDASAD